MARAFRLVSPIRVKCRTCEKHWLPEELQLGKCGRCWEQRSKSARHPQFFTDDKWHYRCSECGDFIYTAGYITWDVLSKEFLLVCIKCSDKKVASDRQYRNTPFGWEQKVQ